MSIPTVPSHASPLSSPVKMASVLTSLDFVMDIRIVVIDQMKKTDHVLVHQHVSLPAQMDNVLPFKGSVTR